MRPLTGFRDPAPSRLTYRMQRLLLTPSFWLFLRAGLPFACAALAAWLYLGDDARRAALVEGAAEMRRGVEQRPEFEVRLLSIEGASDTVDAALRDSLPLDFPVSSFDLDLEAIRRAAEALDAVRTAAVRVRSGGVLELAVVERVPVAVWRSRDGLALLDPEGHRVAALAARSDRPELPLLAGAGADAAVPEALDLLEAAKPVAGRLRGLLRVGERRWDLVLDRDQRVLLPETGAVAALERALAMDEAQNLLSRDLTVLDTRNPRRVTVRLGEEAEAILRGTPPDGTGAN